jgi:adenine-specific DNA-methyltransferase
MKSDRPDKLDLRSHDIAEDKRQELLRLFPEIRTEGGKLDFDRLKLALGETVDVGKERYGMNWPGKADCFRTIQAPSLGTLRPCPEESVNFATTENLIIEGDNLEVLKLLQKSYLGKVKMIYIDPPYNTGSDFIYPDNYTESLQTYLEYTGQVDAEGRKFGSNTDTDGRFHSKWLNMMYPRLYLARNLLREDGVLFVSIDDREVNNLRLLLNEIFGEDSFLGQLVWHSKKGGGGDVKTVVVEHEYVLAFAKLNPESSVGKQLIEPQPLNLADDKGPYRKGRELNKWGAGSARADRPTMFFPIPGPEGEDVYPIRNDGSEGRWRLGKSAMMKIVADGNALFEKRPDGTYIVYERIRSAEPRKKSYRTLLLNEGTAAEGTSTLKDLFGGASPYDYPKPVSLIRKLHEVAGVEDEDLVLDFFAGSGTTAHAVLDLNKQDDGNRSFILVQLPEPTGREDYPTIADITKERVRRVIKKLNDEDAGKLDLEGAKKQDRGLRVFKLAESNFKPWNAEAPKDAEGLAKQLELHVDHIREGRTEQDILYEILLKSGFPLTTPVETLTLAGKGVHSVASGALFICLERELTLELIRAMAEKKPERVVCLDEGFALPGRQAGGNDQLKANAVQIFKTKGVTSFRTV